MTPITTTRPVPVPTSWSAPFWEGTKRQELRIQRCGDCAKAVFFPKRFCPFCLSRNLQWEVASGNGRLYSFTVVKNNPPSAFMGELPFVIAIVTLDEGVRLMATVVRCDPDQLRCDQPVKIVFKAITPDCSLPAVTPA